MRRFWLSILTLGVVACVGVDATRLDHPATTQNAAQIKPDDVRVFFNESEVPRPYTRVAILKAHGDAGLTNQENILSGLRRKAASLGANGIVFSGTGFDRGPILNLDRTGEAVAISFHESTSVQLTEQFKKKNAFRDLTWGTPLPDGMTYVRDAKAGPTCKLYRRNTDALSIGPVPLTEILYSFCDQKLRGVIVRTDEHEKAKLADALAEAWGPYATTRSNSYAWGSLGSADYITIAELTNVKEGPPALLLVIIDREYAQLQKDKNRPMKDL